MPIDTAQLCEAHGPMVLRRCRRLLRDDGKALDAMHDVFVEILRREQTLDQRAPAGLLLRTATNVCLNKLRSASCASGSTPVTESWQRSNATR